MLAHAVVSVSDPSDQPYRLLDGGSKAGKDSSVFAIGLEKETENTDARDRRDGMSVDSDVKVRR